MTQQIINVGNVANDGQGDDIRTAFIKTNDNFTELYQGANSIDVSGNVSGGNLLTPGLISAAGNITASSISVSGNISSGTFFIGNGSQLTGITGTVANTLSALSVTGNINTGNLRTAGLVSAAGNVTGAYILGDGSLLTGIVATSVGVLPTLSVSGNATVGNLGTVGQVTATGNINPGPIDNVYRNWRSGEADRLVSATSPIARCVAICGIKVVGGNISMRILKDGLRLPGETTITLRPRGYHLYFIGARQGLKAGAKVPVTLTFEKAGVRTLEFDLLLLDLSMPGKSGMELLKWVRGERPALTATDEIAVYEYAQELLARHFVGGFEVGAGGGFFDVAALDGAGRVHVHRDQRFGVVDHNGATRGQGHGAGVSRFDLVLDLKA